MNAEFGPPRQLLPREAYFDPAWHDREQSALFDHAWIWAGLAAHLREAGEFTTCRMSRHSLFVVRDMARAARRSGPAQRCGRTPLPGGGRVVRLADLDKHPLDSGGFQLEDMWICEKIQRNLHSSKYRVGPMAEGPGAESPVTRFQRSVLDYLEGMAGEGVE